jgi:N-acetylneuraminate synthase
MSVLVVAEAGVNHDGKLEQALRLCDAAKDADVDAIKFQIFKTESLLTRAAQPADYQSRNVGGEAKTQFEMIKALELSEGDFLRIIEHCRSIDLQFLATPDDEESLAFLLRANVSPIKIGSGELTNIPFLRAIAATGAPVILSTGMGSLGEVERAIAELRSHGTPEITLLHCTTNYPCPPEEANLKAISTLAKCFGVPVGYSDHTEGIEVPIAAVALGAKVIEKHFTIDRTLPGPDHRASLEPGDLAEMVKAVRAVEQAFGSGIKAPSKSELGIMKSVRRSIVAARPIAEGVRYSPENLTTKRTDGVGLPAHQWDAIMDRRAPRQFQPDEPVEW